MRCAIIIPPFASVPYLPHLRQRIDCRTARRSRRAIAASPPPEKYYYFSLLRAVDAIDEQFHYAYFECQKMKDGSMFYRKCRRLTAGLIDRAFGACFSKTAHYKCPPKFVT